MKKFNISLLLILGIFMIVNAISYAYWIRYNVTIRAGGYTVYSNTISESEYNRKWRDIVPYSFREDIKEEECEVSARIKIEREIR